MQGAKCQGPEAMEEGWGSGSTQLFIKIIDTLCAHGRSQTSYIALCNDVVSHGAQIGGLRVLADYTRKNKRNTKASTIFAHHVAFYACLCRWQIQLTNHGYFGNRKTRRPPIWTTCRVKNGPGSGISRVYLWFKCRLWGIGLWHIQSISNTNLFTMFDFKFATGCTYLT